MGATIVRLSQLATTGDGNGNITTLGADKLCRAIKVASDYKTPYILASWSPPAGMKTIEVNGSKTKADELVYLREDKEQTYCDFVVKLFNYISVTKKLPLPLAYSLQNEPLNETIWQGCIYGAAQYQRVVKLMRKTLDAAGYTSILLLGPEDGVNGYVFLGGAGFSSLKDPELNNAISAFSSHAYIWESMNINYNQWVTGCDKWGKDRWQTEYCYIDGGNLKDSHAVGTTRRLIASMAYFKDNYWFGWTVNTGQDSDDIDSYTFGNGSSKLTKKPTYYVLKKIFSSIPVGSKVRRVTSTDSQLRTTNSIRMDMVAFASDTNMVVVMANPTTSAKVTNIKGLTGSSAKVYQMVSAANDTDMELVGSPDVADHQVSGISMPPNSVTIVVTSGFGTKLTDLEINPNQFDVYPNPVKGGVIHIKLKNTQYQGKVSASLIDLQGKVIRTKDFQGKSELSISAPEIQTGTYLVKIQGANLNSIRKIIVP
jgi:O-glycosyl hydrolase